MYPLKGLFVNAPQENMIRVSGGRGPGGGGPSVPLYVRCMRKYTTKIWAGVSKWLKQVSHCWL